MQIIPAGFVIDKKLLVPDLENKFDTYRSSDKFLDPQLSWFKV